MIINFDFMLYCCGGSAKTPHTSGFNRDVRFNICNRCKKLTVNQRAIQTKEELVRELDRIKIEFSDNIEKVINIISE